MNKSASRLFIAVSLLVLISIACNKPVLSPSQSEPQPQSQSDTSESATGESEESDSLTPHNIDGADLTFIPGATFQMGSYASDPLVEENESPAHEVTLEDFYIYTHEVTNQMYETCVTADECIELKVLETGTTSHYGSQVFAEYPAVGVDWVMARDYCLWAGGRLPTEAEWELTSRGPESLVYPWGVEDPTCDHVNMSGCSASPDTQPVGYYLLGNSPDGVWDMSGNVWEWVHDWYAEDYYAQSPAESPIGPLEPPDPANPLRVIRGGGLYSNPVKMRSATRMGLNPYRTFTDVGFRCVVGEGLVLPDTYDHGEDRHDDVPPDSADGDDPDDDSGLRSIRLLAGCRTSEIADLGVNFDPAEPALFSASTDFGPLVCDHHPPPDGTYYCHDLPGSPGDTVNLYFSFTDASEMDAMVEYPPCDVPFWIDDFCDEDATGANTPHLVLHYPPGGPVLVGVAASAGGGPSVDLDFIITIPGTAVCTGLPGVTGDILGVFAAFDDGSTLLGDHTRPFCPDTVGFIPPWDVILSCIDHGDGTAEYRARIETNMAGLDFIPGSWTLWGVPEPKNCILDDAESNIWGCNFPLGAYGDIEFCAEWVGGPGLYCETFDGSLLPDDCSRPPDDDDGGDPVSGYCIEQSPGSCGTNPCLPTCTATGPNERCIPCTMP